MNLINSKRPLIKVGSLFAITATLFLSLTARTLAHHPLGGRVPENSLEGFLSGLAHPVIGLDHLAFVVASGLIAVGLENGILIPVAFVLATLTGTGIHLQKLNLIYPEAIIALSVIAFGLLLVLRYRFQRYAHLYTVPLATLAIVAGVFHGYAYGESIIGAGMASLTAYLVGFCVIQAVIACAAFFAGKLIRERLTGASVNIMLFSGLAIAGIGGSFLLNLK